MSTEGQEKARQYRPLTGMETLTGQEKPTLAAERRGFAEGWDAAAEHYVARDAEVKAQAWDEGYGTGWVDGEQAAHGGEALEPVNPYREGREQ